MSVLFPSPFSPSKTIRIFASAENLSFACPMDFDSYWQGDALRQADKLVTDDIGQMRYYREAGYFKDTPQTIFFNYRINLRKIIY